MDVVKMEEEPVLVRHLVQVKLKCRLYPGPDLVGRKVFTPVRDAQCRETEAGCGDARDAAFLVERAAGDLVRRAVKHLSGGSVRLFEEEHAGAPGEVFEKEVVVARELWRGLGTRLGSAAEGRHRLRHR